MRAAPVGLLVADPEKAFALACDVAAITHGHPSGWLPAGTLAAIIALTLGGAPLDVATERSLAMLAARPGHDETVHAIDRAVTLAALPAEWTSTLDVFDIVTQAADDLWCERFETPADELGNPPDAWWGGNPGW